MSTEQRREQLLRAGVELLRHRPHEEISIEDIANAAGVSKGLLYHYFPTRRAFIVAALEKGQAELAEQLRPRPELAPIASLDAGLAAFLDSVEEHTLAYRAIFKRGGSDPEIAATINAGRERQLQEMVDALTALPDPPAAVADLPILEAALQGWLFFCEGAVLRWIEHGDINRGQLQRMLRSALLGTLTAAGAADRQRR